MTFKEAMRPARAKVFAARRDLNSAMRVYLVGIMEQAGGCVREAAKLAGVNRTSMFRLLKTAKISLDRWPKSQYRARHGNDAWRALQ